MLHPAEGNGLSKFSDPPGDAYLDDLFPLDKRHGEVVGEASTSTSTSHMAKGNASMIDGGEKDLAKELRATIARKQWEKESEIGQANNGGNLLHRVMIGVLKDDVIDIDGLVCSSVFIINLFFLFKIPCLYPFNFLWPRFFIRYLMKNFLERTFFLCRYQGHFLCPQHNIHLSHVVCSNNLLAS